MYESESDILTDKDLLDTYERLSKKQGNKFNFIMKAGCSLQPVLFHLCKTVWETEQIPQAWNKSNLVQLYKGSGPKNLLENYRFIHMKDDFSKTFGNVIMDKARDAIFRNMSKFQIGARPGHRAQEHLFVVKSVISHYYQQDKALLLTFWDIRKYFDSEYLLDVMNELHKNEVRGKLYRLLYLMNSDTRIQIQTPVGPTKEKSTGETLGQGTVEGAIASAVNLDNGVGTFLVLVKTKYLTWGCS